MIARTPTRRAIDRQVGRQRTVPFELAEHLVIVVDDLKEDVGGDVLDIGVRERDAPGMGDVVDDVVDQAHVAVNEIVPGLGLMAQATIEQLFVDLAKRHGRTSSS